MIDACNIMFICVLQQGLIDKHLTALTKSSVEFLTSFKITDDGDDHLLNLYLKLGKKITQKGYSLN